jgi:hypothetical protein
MHANMLQNIKRNLLKCVLSWRQRSPNWGSPFTAHGCREWSCQCLCLRSALGKSRAEAEILRAQTSETTAGVINMDEERIRLMERMMSMKSEKYASKT